MTSKNLLSTYELPQVDDSAVDDSIRKAMADLEKLEDNDGVENSEDSEEIKEPIGEEIEELQEELEEIEEPEGIEVEPEKKREKKSDKDQYRKLQNDKYRAQAEKAAADERIRELEDMLTESLSAGTYHYGKNAYAALDNAKEAKRKALREGDEDKLVEADIEIVKALTTINELEKWANNGTQKTSKAVSNVREEPEVDRDMELKRELASDWLESHPYLNSSSRKYDPNLESKVFRFVKKLDYDLEANRQQHLHYTPEYFDKIDDYIDTVKAKKASNTIAALPPVGGVRNSYNGKGRTEDPAHAPLTKEEKEHIKSMAGLGVTEENYRQHRVKDGKNV
jgi:hypothetical protein